MKRRLTLKQLITEEYKKCALDPAYFLNKFCVIQHPKRGKIPFNLFPYQEKCLDEFTTNRWTIILKSRQLGLSTLCAGYSLWMMLFHTDKNILVIATKQSVAKNLITKVRVMHDNLPSWLRQEPDEDNKMSLKFSNGSGIKSESSKPDAGRSEALSLLVLDEAAFIDYIDDIWTASQQTLATGGDCIVLSTPNGVGNWFHEQWVEAEEGRSNFVPIKLHWTMHPERDQAWRDKQTELLGQKMASQECDTSFLTSGETVIDLALLKWYEETYIKPPREKRGFDQNLWIWEYPNYTRDYMVVADVARGDSTDFSAFHVIDIESMTQVAEYKGKPDTETFGQMLISVATEWNKALLVVENSGIGWAAVQPIITNGYPNLFYMSKDIKYLDVARQLHNKHNREEKKMVAGFSTTAKTRPLIISKLDLYFRERSVIVRSSRLINELTTFIWKSGRAEAMKKHNDDLVISLAIAMWVRDTALRLRQHGMDITKKTIDKFTVNQGVYNSKELPYDPYLLHLNEHETEDLRNWL